MAEDRQKALKLLSHLDIRKPLVTINSYNEEEQLAMARCRPPSPREGKKAALITAAGTPCISTPAILL